jgi:hypothetical protein
MSKPFVKVEINEDGSSIVELHAMTPLNMMYVSMILIDKVYDALEINQQSDMQEAVGSILESMAALVQLAATPTPDEIN